jgi:hypothetical protein
MQFCGLQVPLVAAWLIGFGILQSDAEKSQLLALDLTLIQVTCGLMVEIMATRTGCNEGIFVIWLD